MGLSEIDCQRLIREAMVPGMATAVLQDGRVHGHVCCGVRHVQCSDRIDEDTVFDAASLSKPVFAYAVLQLVDQGRLSLDAPLGIYLPEYARGDERVATITARHVLSHSGGMPNWRSPDLRLKTYFEPGERFSYSGEGFLYLQRAVEAVTRERLHELTARLVLEPLGMSRSSYIWEWQFEPNRAYPHDVFGRPALGYKPGEGNAAWSLQTTAADYARFLLGVLDGFRLRPETARAWLTPEITVRHPAIQNLQATADGEVSTGVGWGLGWGLELASGHFFHWGDIATSTSFVIGSLQRRDALVCFWNGASGLAMATEVVGAVIPGDRPSLAWLKYSRIDDPVRRILRAATSEGIAAVWSRIEAAEFKRDEILWIAQGLTAAGRDEDSRWLRDEMQARASS